MANTFHELEEEARQRLVQVHVDRALFVRVAFTVLMWSFSTKIIFAF